MDTEQMDFDATRQARAMGVLLRHHRQLAGRTIADVATEAGVSRTRLTLVEQGKMLASLRWYFRVAIVLRLTLDLTPTHDFDYRYAEAG